jgi:hypothetical protein
MLMMDYRPEEYADVITWMYHPYRYIWPDNSPESELSRRLVAIKRLNSKEFWPEMRKILLHDLETNPIEYFRSWASTLIIPLSVNVRYVEPIINCVALDEKYFEALRENWTGVYPPNIPYLRLFDNFNSSALRCQNMFHLLYFGLHDKVSGYKSIIELGGGYGDMATLISRLGFNGTYTIFDFPELGKLQEYYLGMEGVKANFISDIDNLPEAELVIATWSLSEMPWDLRADLLKRLSGAKAFLIVTQDEIFGIDNFAWFDTMFSDYDAQHVYGYYSNESSRLSLYTRK